MTKAELIKLLEPLNDDTEIKVLVNNSMYPSQARFFSDTQKGDFFLITRAPS